MIIAAGLCQLGAAALNVVLLWRWLPPPGSEDYYDEDDE